MTYQNVTGPLMANSHPGSYCGQDAYNDMFVTEKLNESKLGRIADLTHPNSKEQWGGQRMPDKENFNAVLESEEMKTVVRR